MSIQIIFLIIGLALGTAAGWIIAKFQDKAEIANSVSKNEANKLTEELNNIKTTLQVEIEKNRNLSETLDNKEKILNQKEDELKQLTTEVSSKKTLLESLEKNVSKIQQELDSTKNILENKRTEIENLNKNFSLKELEYNALKERLSEKLDTQKKEIEEIKVKFNIEFQNIANKILEEKTQKFTELNKNNLETILKPLGENIENFKKKVEETYDRESKERFSLEKEIKSLVEMNQKISVEANNLTKALKADVKKLGNWGEMILENILENSGLVKDREYFVQNYLKDADGNILKNEDGTKMQPDIIISYPDNRKIIIDSKVSLLAYEKYISSDDKIEQEEFLREHIKSIKNHIDNLSSKNYSEYAETLDFVMMFIPIEPAYLIAIQKENGIWNYAYSKRVLLISPTNLIAALKLVADLWKREYQNRNAIEIAKRGEQLYDKFVNFIESLQDVGEHIEKTQKSYNKAMTQLKEGSGNLIGQAQKLKELGLKPKKSLPIKMLGEPENDSEESE